MGTSANYYKIKCDCCGEETLAEIRGDKIVIMDRRHGRKHIAVLTLREIFNKMKQITKGGEKD
ncbi:MAG: hypothetical protein ABIB93_08080 [Chloroflexota bacterium]